LDSSIILQLDQDCPCIELDLRSRFLGSVRQVLVEGSAVKNPRDWGLTLELKNLA
jgi:hypothetical protein